jgi:indolepyruvate ferredoxin oxidoreductase alpha subunit
MEISFKSEIESLPLGAGEIFRGEGILAVTKALLQSGVAYVGGYQGAPVSHLLDVMVQSRGLLDELGIHLETCTNEAAAAAMLGASIGYPLRGAVTWKSIVGTNVASDALSNLASSGVMGGVLIVVGEDYGEGASVIQERTHAFALKSSMWLLDPRPNLPTIVRTVELGFELSEASNTPVMLELRVRACHVYGEFVAKDNVKPGRSRRHRFAAPAPFDYDRLSHPPSTFAQEEDKVAQRRPAAEKFIIDNELNEFFGGELSDIGIILQGGLYNAVVARLEQMGFADLFGNSRVPLFVLNVTHPLVASQIESFCATKRTVLIVEEGGPEFMEQAIQTILRRADLQTDVLGKSVLPMAGEYTAEVLLKGIAAFLEKAGHGDPGASILAVLDGHRQTAARHLGSALPARPPTFCTGCPERPVFSAMKLLQREIGPVHVAADIGCHALATLPPFDSGQSILGYGMSMASAAAVSSTQERRPISIMGDGGFWHNGMASGLTGAVFNQTDSVLIVMNNGYSSATGIQALPSSAAGPVPQSPSLDIGTIVRALGVKWLRKVRTYDVATVLATLREAMQTGVGGPKVIVAEGECQLARQRRVRGEVAEHLRAGKRTSRLRFGIDDDICTGDRACIRLSGCPSLTVKPSADLLRTAPVTTVTEDCVGCGLCGELAHEAQLCPSFYEAEVVQNPSTWERFIDRIRRTVIGWLAGPASAAPRT